MYLLKIKVLLDGEQLVSVKWAHSSSRMAPSFTGFISEDYFSEIILSGGYARISKHITRSEIKFLPYEKSDKILKSLLGILRHQTYRKISAADEATLSFLTGLKLPKKITEKIVLDEEASNAIDQAMLDGSKSNKYGLDSLKDQLALISYLSGLIEEFINTENLPDEVDQSLVQDLYAKLVSSDICWETTSRYRKISEIDPKSVVVGGPLLTTKNDPWPGEKDYFYEPLCQLPTDLVNFFTDYDGPSGMAQFFFANGIYSRIIKIDQPVAPPKEVISEIQDFRNDDTVFEIIGIAPPKIYICYIDDHLLDNISPLIGPSEMYLFSLLKIIAKNNKVKSPNFMGSFYSIQYNQRVDHKCILALENEMDVNFGDCGNGQVFLGENGLFGMWSCY